MTRNAKPADGRSRSPSRPRSRHIRLSGRWAELDLLFRRMSIAQHTDAYAASEAGGRPPRGPSTIAPVTLLRLRAGADTGARSRTETSVDKAMTGGPRRGSLPGVKR